MSPSRRLAFSDSKDIDQARDQTNEFNGPTNRRPPDTHDAWISELRELRKRNPDPKPAGNRLRIRLDPTIGPDIDEDPWILQGEGVDNTVNRHRSLIQRLLQYAASQSGPMSFRTITGFLRRERLQRVWIPSTLATNAGSLMGAIRQVWAQTLCPQLKTLSQHPNWKTLLRGLAREAIEEGINWPEVLTVEEMRLCIEIAPTIECKLILALAFAGALRICDALCLTPQDCINHFFVADDCWALLIRGGKTSKSIPQCSYIILPILQKEWHQLLSITPKRQRLFPQTTKFRQQLLASIRAANPKAESRSIRATTLLYLAFCGVPEAEIKDIANHATITSTRRYLRFGLADASKAEKALSRPSMFPWIGNQ